MWFSKHDEPHILHLPYHLQLTLVWNKAEFPRLYQTQVSAVPRSFIPTQYLRLCYLPFSWLFCAVLKVVVSQMGPPKDVYIFQKEVWEMNFIYLKELILFFLTTSYQTLQYVGVCSGEGLSWTLQINPWNVSKTVPTHSLPNLRAFHALPNVLSTFLFISCKMKIIHLLRCFHFAILHICHSVTLLIRKICHHM